MTTVPKQAIYKKHQRWGALALSLVLLIPGLFISGGSSIVEGAAYTHIVGQETFDEYDTSQVALSLDNGYKALLSQYGVIVSPVVSKKYRPFYNSYGSTKIGYVYISNGKLFTQKIDASPIQKADNVIDFQVLTNSEYSNIDKFSYFILKQNGSVWAWGAGAYGQLAVGPSGDKSVPTEVLDPSGSVLTGVQKLYYLSPNAFLAVRDNTVYLIGSAFGLTSRGASSKAVDVTSLFPAFTSAENFQMSFLNDNNHSLIATRPGGANWSEVKADIGSRIFTINGQSYSLTNWKTYRDPLSTTTEIDSATPALIPIPSDVDVNNVHRYTKTLRVSASDYLLNGYTTIKNGVLKYWGTPFSGWSSGSSAIQATSDIAADVESVVGDGQGTFWYLKAGKIYSFGTNLNSRSGVSGGVLNTPVQVTGTSNEIANVKQLSASGGYTYALKDTHELIYWNSASQFTKSTQKYLSLFSLPDRYGVYTVYGITETGVFQSLPYGSAVSGFPTVFPADYVALDKPTSTLTLDKYNRSIVTVEFGNEPMITTNEYSLDGGTTWLPYTAPVTLTTTGTLSFKARSGASGIYSEILEIEVTNDPILITPGYPKIIDNGKGSYTVESGTTHPSIRTEVRMDNGTWGEYKGPVTLPEGSHVVDVRLVNAGGEELATGNKTINGPTPVPTPVPTISPTATPTPTPTPTVAPTATPLPTVAPTGMPTPTTTPQPTMDPSWGSPIGSEDVSFTVLSGGFNSQFNGLKLDTITISTTNQYQVLNSVTNSVIEDSRGTGAGWNYSLKVTDFFSDPVVDNSLGTNDLVVKMPSTALSVDVTKSSTLAGQDSNLSLNGNYIFNQEPVILASASEFHGMGQYQIPMSFTLRVPDKVEIVTAGNGSEYQAGGKTGLRVGTYRSQFTFTLASGI